jgi:hypothetical protein
MSDRLLLGMAVNYLAGKIIMQYDFSFRAGRLGPTRSPVCGTNERDCSLSKANEGQD